MTAWSPEGPEGLVKLHCTSESGNRLVLVTGADGGVGFETALALLLAGCDVLMGIRDFDRPGHWARVQERLDCRIVDELMKKGDKLNASPGHGKAGPSMDDVGRALPFKCDFTDMVGARGAAQEVWSIVAEHNQAGAGEKSVVGAITHYIGTVGVGFDRPTLKGELVSRYTENDDGIEYQLGINAINPFIFTLLVWPLLARPFEETAAKEAAPVDGRIVLTNSIANAWNTLPLAVEPQYRSWETVRGDGGKRWAAGRYNFSKLTQLLLLTKLRDISPSLVAALQSSLESHTPLIAPFLLSLHPGEVNTPFLDLMLPSWRCTWIEQMTCLTPRQGAWTGLWGCVVDLAGVPRPRLSGMGSKFDSQADVGYHYLLSLCTFGKPCSLARDSALINDCWRLVGSRLAFFHASNTDENGPVDGLTLHSWEGKLSQVVKASLE
ncbi:hypothetical protein BCV69DRAFT_314567 [Microstroma glucosiphilum]|uniref:NAD(P)-binding protein n=1 Tax=Pseudomicrostroma glucosiphilum TaxID=1684307 RepID=A0A316U0E2_9BASI|nr:hypothetical protein BCV69DRAFT_314567 [Pseudomicrostroma glucosiphilum]PWN18690.1 hypothetical protein BCV69DRAFT_314567 [Pseudomicrostroma glucosiphilum]